MAANRELNRFAVLRDAWATKVSRFRPYLQECRPRQRPLVPTLCPCPLLVVGIPKLIALISLGATTVYCVSFGGRLRDRKGHLVPTACSPVDHQQRRVFTLRLAKLCSGLEYQLSTTLPRKTSRRLHHPSCYLINNGCMVVEQRKMEVMFNALRPEGTI